MNKDFQNFKLAAEHAPIHIIFTDIDGVVLYANLAAQKLTGYSREEIIGNNPRLWGRQMPHKFYKKLWKTIKYDKKVFAGEIKNRRKNGELYIALARIAPALDENGKLAGFIGIEQDITKEKQVDQAKSEFVSLASHQLKNPLFLVNWYTDILLKEKVGFLNLKQRKYLQEIKNANKKMTNLINSLLNVSKIELGKFANEPKKIQLIRFTKKILKEFNPRIEEKQISLAVNFSEKEITIKIDPKLLTIILENLLSNAIKYTPKKGKVELEISLSHLTSHLLIKVSDTGVGIPKKEQNKIFEKLYRASNAKTKDKEGTGLGLYMVKSLLEQNEGKIRFESVGKKGTTFFVELPISR